MDRFLTSGFRGGGGGGRLRYLLDFLAFVCSYMARHVDLLSFLH